MEFIFDEDGPKGKPNVTEGLLHSIIRDSLAANFGEVGWAQVGSSLTSPSASNLIWVRVCYSDEDLHSLCTVKYWSQTTGLCIVRTSRPTLPVVWGAITFIRAIKDVGCCARMIHVGGKLYHHLVLERTRTLSCMLDRHYSQDTTSCNPV